MFRRDSIEDDFAQLHALSDAHARGKQFERFVARLFRAARFRVERNPGTAHPRQTDLLAMGGGRTYLIETKWDSDPADVDVLDSLFSRLEDTPQPVIGVLISVSGFSRTVVERLEKKRSRHVLLVDGDELQDLVSNVRSLTRALRRKEQHLLVHGKALTGGSAAMAPRARRAGELPRSDAAFVWPDGRRADSLACSGGFGEFVFVLDLPDSDWTHGASFGVDLDIQFVVFDGPGFIRVLGAMSDLGWITAAGHWSIQQVETNWHGFGAHSFAEAITQWELRYHDLRTIHHTEQLCYQDVCDDGFYVLTADVSAAEHRAIGDSELSLRLHGIPLDPSPILDLCDALEIDFPQYFRPRNERSLVRQSLQRARVPVGAIAYVVQRDESASDPFDRDWVTGIVVPNPFRGRGQASRKAPGSWPAHLADSEVLICSLRSWHPLAQPKSRYHLTRCEWAETSDALAMRVIADWD